MLKRAILILAIGVILSSSYSLALAEEVYFKFNFQDRAEIELLTHVISIANVKDGEIYAYANDKEFAEFLKLGYTYTMLPKPSTLIQPHMTDNLDEILDLTYYPTYDAYVSMMNQFAADYPSLCSIVTIGDSEEGRKLIALKISDNVGSEEAEPEVFYTSSMHGDETTGYPMMISLIEYLLTNYGSDPQATNLVNNLEIYINPLANPDGTYAGGNNTVWGATRGNANGVDINRNFPDPEDGDHPDGNAWQPETVAMMAFAEAHSFVISANFHGGAEVVNYPWDTWSRRHADDDWWIDVSRDYADSAQANSPSGYMTDLDNGITNGYDWYTISGGRQDYMNFWHGCREVTIELSSTYTMPEDLLDDYWNYNRAALLCYIENALYGIRGTVTDFDTGLPLEAQIEVVGHDLDNSYVYTDPDHGDYYRMIDAGTYDLRFTADGYTPQTIEDVYIGIDDVTIVDVQLEPFSGQLETVYSDDFSSNQGWTGMGGNGEWTIGAATGGSGGDSYGEPDPSVDNTPGSNNGVLGNDLTSGTGGDYNADLDSTYWVTSPVIDCTDHFNVSLTFYRWLGIERNDYDHVYLQVYNGSTWTTIFENGSSTIDETSWNEMQYDVSGYADGSSSFQIRFGIGETDGSWQYCGWNIDDLEVTGWTEEEEQPAVFIDMIPDNPPVVVQPGGYFTFTGILANNTPTMLYGDVWIMLELPAGGQYGPLQNFQNIPLSPNDTLISTGVRQNIPGYAILGDYKYIAYAGMYPSYKTDSCDFDFSIVSGMNGNSESWLLSGWFEGTEIIPQTTSLNGNYPNPFNAATNIKYDLAEDGHVSLRVYNVLGQQVETLVDSYQTAGSKTINWDASTYSSGVYFYELSAGDKTFTKRMMLVK
ncbi:MAG: T9SS type A sorting domain-containing protein [candidate division Zixibacteria bacterium]|nr:T9SS type A sorting domain-containing protein [candidate division Zixibacteria bacterium]